MKFLGIDQSLRETGLCILDVRAVYDTLDVTPVLLKILPVPYRKYPEEAIAKRILFDTMKQFLNGWREITHAAVESCAIGATNQKFTLGGVETIMEICLLHNDVRFIRPAPVYVKWFACEKLNATKENVMEGMSILLRQEITNDNMADAASLAYIAACKYYNVAKGRKCHEMLANLSWV